MLFLVCMRLGINLISVLRNQYYYYYYYYYFITLLLFSVKTIQNGLSLLTYHQVKIFTKIL